MNTWIVGNETSLPDKESFYSNLNMEDITDVDHRHARRVFNKLHSKILVIKIMIYMFRVMLADVLENFRNMCIKVYELDPAHFLSAPGLAWQACLK